MALEIDNYTNYRILAKDLRDFILQIDQLRYELIDRADDGFEFDYAGEAISVIFELNMTRKVD
jgi:hypothetical protein